MSTPRRPDPRLLILETSGKRGHVAVAHGSKLLTSRTLDEARRHARDLAPAIVELCRGQGWKVRDLDGVVVSLGPGSYTGLRVGIMSAKTLAYATGCVALGIETFSAVAHQSPADANSVDVIADAQRQQVYGQRWRRNAAGWQAEPLRIRPLVEWLADLEAEVWVSGPAVALHEAAIPAAHPRVSAERRDPQPESLLELALARWQRGEADDPLALEPLYLRPSSAEENWKGK